MKDLGINKTSNSIKKQLIIAIVSFLVFAIVLLSVLSAYIGFKYAGNALNTVEIIAAVSIVVIMIILSIVLAGNLTNRITNPLNLLARRLETLAKGDLHSDVEIINRKDEIGLLSNAINNIVKELNSMFIDMEYNLSGVDDGDFTRYKEREFPGDFEKVGVRIHRINLRLNRLIGRFRNGAEQVATGADQMAANTQDLSQGATDQASSIEELAATINELSEQIKQNAKNAETAKNSSLETSFEVENGKKHMDNMVLAMDEIKNASMEISKIIKTIDDIAFQTNILALNAAVEAARAGAAGKGFAVVAEEVRNLASKSAEAAKNTTELIEGSLFAVEKGSEIAYKTEESLNTIVDKVKTTVELVEQISEASAQQAIGASQVLLGVEQISSVVQTNTKNTEDNAAASEELSSLSQELKGYVVDVILRDIKNYDID